MAAKRQPPAIITLTTDFGDGSRYVAAMKGVILSINPQAQARRCHRTRCRAQDVRAGAIVLAETARWFPPETIHVAVVDPGVGSSRRIVYARIGTQQFIAPDNGLLSRLATAEPPSKIVSIEEPRVLAAGRVGHVSRARHHGAGRRPAEPGPVARQAWAGRSSSSWNFPGRRYNKWQIALTAK